MHSTSGSESKIIMLGLSQAGKTSIRQVVFEGFAPVSTALNPATVRINRKIFNFAGGSINVLDIGGQTSYLNEAFQQYRESTFSDVKAAIFVVDISDAANIMRANYYFDLTLKTLSEFSRDARIFVFAHKLDLIPLDKRAAVVQSIAEIFKTEKYPQVNIYGTSIFDDTIWEAMQQVLAFAYPRDQTKTNQLKSIIGSYNLAFLALSTSQGLVLYSEPRIVSGINYTRMKNDLTKTYFSGMLLNQAIFSFANYTVFMKEIEEDLVVTTVFPAGQKITKDQEVFNELINRIWNLFQPDELLRRAKDKMRQTLADYLKANRMRNVKELERAFDTKISIKCDVCGKQIQKSLLDVALENSEQLDRGVKVSAGLGVTTVVIFPVHECIEGIREIPVVLDNNLEYRRYERSRPI